VNALILAGADGSEVEDAIARNLMVQKAGIATLASCDITGTLRSSVEELKGEVASLDHTLRILEAMVNKRERTLPGLPGGPPLKD
jgi:hypothetical protein